MSLFMERAPVNAATSGSVQAASNRSRFWMGNWPSTSSSSTQPSVVARIAEAIATAAPRFEGCVTTRRAGNLDWSRSRISAVPSMLPSSQTTTS